MAFNEDLKNNLHEMKSEAKAYLETNIDYYSLWGFKVASKAAGFIFKIFALSLFAVLSLFFLSFAAAFAIGKALDSNTFGFLIIGGFYIVVALVVYSMRKAMIDIPILKKFSRIFFD